METKAEDYFRKAPEDEIVRKTTVEKDHGRIETRIFTASKAVDWIKTRKTYPGQPKFNRISTILKVVNRTESKDHCTQDARLYISSAALDIERLANGARGHWGRATAVSMARQQRGRLKPLTLTQMVSTSRDGVGDEATRCGKACRSSLLDVHNA